MRHQMRTALALYDTGTMDLETAARKAGVSPDRFERSARRHGVTPSARTAPGERERVPVGAD